LAIVELLPVPVEPTQIMQVPALSSSSGGSTGGKLTRAETENRLHCKFPYCCLPLGWGLHWWQVNACWNRRLITLQVPVLLSSSGGSTGGKLTRAETGNRVHCKFPYCRHSSGGSTGGKLTRAETENWLHDKFPLSSSGGSRVGWNWYKSTPEVCYISKENKRKKCFDPVTPLSLVNTF
jgi:hypothetical protein